MAKLVESIQRAFNRIGLFQSKWNDTAIPLLWQNYDGQDAEKIREHRDFLLRLEENEHKRLDSIEAKTSQLIAQTGIIFSLLGLFIPIMMDKAASLSVNKKVFIISLLILASFFYLLTIHNALKNFWITKFKYIRPSPNNVLNLKDASLEDFLIEEVKDILNGNRQHVHINNKKGSNLLHSYNCFKIANIFTGLLIVLFSVFILKYSSEKDSVKIDGPVEIKDLEKFLQQQTKPLSISDKLIIKAKDSALHQPVKKAEKPLPK